MKAIDSLLTILAQQGGTELRLLSDRRPRMFQGQAELALTVPAMSTAQICDLLGDLWTAHQETLQDRGAVVLSYRSDEAGAFDVRLLRPTPNELEARFYRAGTEASSPSSARAPATVVASAPASGDVPPALTQLLVRVVARGASDIHLSPQRAPIVRINAALEQFDDEVRVDAALLLSGDAQRKQVEAGVSVDRALDVPGVGRVRVNVYNSHEGLCAAIRILKREVPELRDLGLPAHLATLVEHPHGLIIACGPTGSGKSTTLAALAQQALRLRPQVLVTLEDPIEYVIRPVHSVALVRQREVGTHVRDFNTGLRDALREDPDMLLIGEMRDAETISLALTAAETGHLVFASLHSRTASSAVERIIDTYPPERQRQIRVQLADALRAVIAQRLVPTADGSGRVPAVELLRVTHGVANLIREGRTAQIVNAQQAGGVDGMMVLERHLAELIRSNRIRRETALGVANDVNALGEYLRTAGA